ncbi:GntR family transcriptional regulator [Methylovirgula sp. 4M-Z18]|uniref:GntR family transcriptional regulator n=1 Tax=Methylovirgula sp. 4M-Z18 TaxID=2293567 RepID=UPI000E2FE886|nr:GntR family transcriptional regulator [Methylovirgula sp. 4M-Z18]RFB79875.1 GntR family transcriptional regulator [Methylovirgula sp. 4M-Z18]
MPDPIDLMLKTIAGPKSKSAPLYLQLRASILDAIRKGSLPPGDALPSEREIAARAKISRVTVRKALRSLVEQGVLVQRHGSGTFVAAHAEPRVQPLSRLTSFTDDMARRGKRTHSLWLERGIHLPSPQEMMVLGLTASERVTRVHRLRFANDTALAVERVSIAASLLPNPEEIVASLYAALAARGNHPVRAVQRISAAIVDAQDAELLRVPPGSAGLDIERISYLGHGKTVEFTRSVYRSDIYDFVAEMQLGESSEGEEH